MKYFSKIFLKYLNINIEKINNLSHKFQIIQKFLLPNVSGNSILSIKSKVLDVSWVADDPSGETVCSTNGIQITCYSFVYLKSTESQEICCILHLYWCAQGLAGDLHLGGGGLLGAAAGGEGGHTRAPALARGHVLWTISVQYSTVQYSTVQCPLCVYTWDQFWRGYDSVTRTRSFLQLSPAQAAATALSATAPAFTRRLKT